ncbi:MAG: hypothetical protein HYU36_14420 [Planctomycetes bacterium]|nr:hypothetical protein [Planctomycetota bacterium]
MAIGVAILGIALCRQLLGGTLGDFKTRLEPLEKNIPKISLVAEAHADVVMDHPDAILWAIWQYENGFFDELHNRSGGLARVVPLGNFTKPNTSEDLVIASIRSWDDPRTFKLVADFLASKKEHKSKLLLFASRSGMPKDFNAHDFHGEIDFLIDNFAPSGDKRLARVNDLANTMNSWMWVCEFAAAMTRRGKYPGIFRSIQAEGGEEWTRNIQTDEGRYRLFDYGGAPIPAGRLAAQYAARVRRLLEEVSNKKTDEELSKAAEIIVARMKSGRQVGISGCCHAFGEEIIGDHISGIKPFQNPYGDTGIFKENLAEGDLLIWFSYVGMIAGVDKHIDEAQIDKITCYVPPQDNEATQPATTHQQWRGVDASGALAHVDQQWRGVDSEVEIPFPPKRMAAVSGLNQILLYHMLDEKIAALLKKTGQTNKIVPEYLDEVK